MESTIQNLINYYNIKREIIINDEDNQYYINSYVNHIYVINLEEDNIRRKYVTVLMKKYNINFEFIIVPRLQLPEYIQIGNPNIKLGEAGCYLSHMYCLHDAIANNYKKIIIFEDDIIFHKQFCELFEKITQNQTFDILFLGASDFNFSKNNYKLIKRDKLIYKPHINSLYLRGTFAIFYSDKGCLEVFKERLYKPTFMDDKLIQFIHTFSDSFYVCYPNLVLADLSTTNIEHNFWITNKLKENYYYKNCYNKVINFKDYNYICMKLFSNCSINNNLTYKDNMIHLFDCFFKKPKDKHLIQLLKERFNYDFFTVDDLINICN
jgi:glycosyl transferase family 25